MPRKDIAARQEYERERYEKNKDKIAGYGRERYTKNKDKLLEGMREYHAANKVRIAEKNREYGVKNKDKLADKHREYYAKNKSKRAEYARDYRAKNIEKLVLDDQKKNLRRKYGLTLESYDALVESQKGVCAICQEPCSIQARLSVDHCHDTGKVRGLLCALCNRGLGHFLDSPLRLKAAISYLLKD